MDQNRVAAFKILMKMEKNDGFSNLVIKDYLASNNVDSPDLVRRLVYGVLENKIYLDYFLDKLMSKGISGTKPEVLNILRIGAYQLDFMDSIPDYAALNTAVELSKKYARGMDKLVNGVLRNWKRKRPEIKLPDIKSNYLDYLSVKYSCNKDIVSLLVEQRGNEIAEEILRTFQDSDNRTALSVRVNRIKETIDQVKEKLLAIGFEGETSELSPRVLRLRKSESLSDTRNITDTEVYSSGLISIQSEESCWISDITEVKPGYKVLDLCAAPGGKTLAMAEAMENRGLIFSCDLYPHRLTLLEKNMERLGISIVETRAMDATKRNEVDKIDGEFDVVLVDAPCSGLGVIGSKPEIKLRAPKTGDLTWIQTEILSNAARKVSRGGKLVYSTCTIDRRENDEIVNRFLTENKDFSLEFEKQLLPLSNTETHEGFYVARMKKN